MIIRTLFYPNSIFKVNCYQLSLTESLSQKRFVDEVAGTMLGREAEIGTLLGYAMGNIENLQFGGLIML